jgi:transposase-like protein
MDLFQINPVRNPQFLNGVKCPKCSKGEFWETAGKRLKCKNCRYIFTPHSNPLNTPNEVLKEIVSELLLEHSTNVIIERVKISKYKLLKILTLLRVLLTKDIPDNLSGIIKLDEDYFKKIIKKESLGDFKLDNNIKYPVIGILCKEGNVYAKILPNIGVEDLKFLIKRREKEEPPNHYENWHKYIGLAFKGSLYRTVLPEKKEHRIDALETFWGYLKRKVSAKGGIRKEKLPLYLGEYAWRYNHRKMTFKQKEERLLNLLSNILNQSEMF